MILTCPACATQYTVKEGAIPPEGRKVRCASCKHSWHQDPDPVGEAQPVAPEEAIGPPVAAPDQVEPAAPGIDDDLPDVATIAGEPQPSVEAGGSPPLPAAGLDGYAPPAEALEAPADDADDHDFAAIPAMHDEEEPRSSRALAWIVGLVLLVGAAAAAFWFLAPPEYKARMGLAEAGETPLELMLTTSDRQKLASGNELLAISGRIINPTDRTQAVPPIQAELRNKATKQLVYRWTIAPPARSLPPRGSASFNSAEVDIPEGGDELTVTLGGQPG